MAQITGRYGAVEISLPRRSYDDNKGVDANGNAIPVEFTDLWNGSKGFAQRGENDLDYTVDGKYVNIVDTELPDSGTKTNGIELFIPDADSPYSPTSVPTIVSSITSWSLDNSISPIEYTASNTHGYRGKLAGLHDATGNIAGLGAIPPIAPGQRFRFYGFTGPKNGAVKSTDGLVYAITAIANSVQINVSYQWNNPIMWTVGWQADWHQEGDELTVTDGEGSGFWDYTKVPCCALMPSKTKNLRIFDENNKDMADLCLLDANIQFTNETAQYANSCSASAGGWQSRLPGPTTCTVSTNIQGDDFRKTGSLLPGVNHGVQIYVGDDSEDCGISWWYFHKLFFTGFSGLNVDTSNNSPLQFSCNMDFNAFPDCDPGYILFKDNSKKDVEKAPKFLIDLRNDGNGGIPDFLL